MLGIKQLTVGLVAVGAVGLGLGLTTSASADSRTDQTY